MKLHACAKIDIEIFCKISVNCRSVGEAVKPGLDWSLDSGLDWTMDWTLDWTGLEVVWVQLLLAIESKGVMVASI